MTHKLEVGHEEDITPSSDFIEKNANAAFDKELVHHDPNGFPVIPQPSSHRDDPLVPESYFFCFIPALIFDRIGVPPSN